MVEITRRLFLIGSAAAITAAAIPFATPIEALAPYKVRKIVGVTIAPHVHLGPDCAILAEIYRLGPGALESPIWSSVVGSRDCVRWRVLYPMAAIVVTNEWPIKLAWTSERGVGEINLECLDTIDDGPPVELVERHHFAPSQGPARIIYMHADNSFEARLAREEAIRARLADEIASWDEELDDDGEA